LFTACGRQSPLSIASCTISEASTGIDYYYYIYLDISIYILRRSKRQAFQKKQLGKVPRFTVWSCGVF
jgi:hypothetical protein